MTTTQARAYLSPTLVLLAMDWPDGENRHDFLGFAVKRTPGFQNLKTLVFEPFSWLPNRLSFNGPPRKGEPDFPSNQAPIQKFLWWDARLEGLEVGQPIQYEVSAVTGTAQNPFVEETTTTKLTVAIPQHVEFGIGTWFNRAVMSSQAFSRKVEALGLTGNAPTTEQALSLREWLANGMEKPLPAFIANAPSLVGAIYHLTDNIWIIPSLKSVMGTTRTVLVYDSNVEKDPKTKKPKPNPNDDAITELNKVQFRGRDKTNIMHNKYLVAGDKLTGNTGQKAVRLTCGSANYTTEGLTSQANLLHTFESSELANLYFKRFNLLKSNPTLGATSKESGWSNTISVGDTGIRVFFSPEPGKPGEADSVSIETIVQSVHKAQSSVVFCLFTPTDKKLRDACFAVGDAGKMMFGLVNNIAEKEPVLKPTSTGKIPADQIAALEIYHRSKDKKDIIDAEYFHPNTIPTGFEVEMNLFPGTQPPPYPPVIIHHKFIVIDAETESPTIYTGSANMSGNSVFKNDENLLEIKGSPRLARIYLSEFLRLYEHYRARARFIAFKKSGAAPANAGFALAKDRSWADEHYKSGTPEYKARVKMLSTD
jgi:phosphatidylserine/phosphatidylglycerophosphate/cardiolipin synthase-like enzyme